MVGTPVPLECKKLPSISAGFLLQANFFVLDDWLPNGFKLKMAVLRQIEALGYLKSEIFVTRDTLWDNLPATSHEVRTGVLKFLVTVEDKLECDS